MKQGFRPVFPPTHPLSLQQQQQQHWQSPSHPGTHRLVTSGGGAPEQMAPAQPAGELLASPRLVQQQVSLQLARQVHEQWRYVHWDDEGLRLALGVCPTTLPDSGGAPWPGPGGGSQQQRADAHAQVGVRALWRC